MADPTIKDVLDAITTLRGEIGRLDTKIETVRADVATVRADVSAHRRETAKGFADLNEELERHSDPVHRKLEDDVAMLKRQVVAKKAAVRPTARRPRRG